MVDVDLAYYGMESLITHAQHLNALSTPVQNALPKYDIMADAIIWPDETNDRTPIEVIDALRQLRHYRTYVMLKNESPNPAVWDACKSLFPNWVGFRTERCVSTPELVECYRREEIKSRWCLRKSRTRNGRQDDFRIPDWRRMSDLIREQYLTDLFRRYEDSGEIVRVTFSFGECYDLRICSTMHAEAGGDIVAFVIQSIKSDDPAHWKTIAMNFKLEDVVRIEVDGECVFDMQHDA